MEPDVHSAPAATVSELCGKWFAGMLSASNPTGPLHTGLINSNALFSTGAFSRELCTGTDEPGTDLGQQESYAEITLYAVRAVPIAFTSNMIPIFQP